MEQNIQTASFVEKVVVSSAQATNPVFDIILDEKGSLQNYCDALINKVFELLQSDFHSFINYQADLVKEPIIWLNQFEELIANNEELFTGKRALSRYNKLFNLIEQKRKEVQSLSVKVTKIKTPKRLINADTEDRYFSFCEIKEHIESLENFNEKVMFLTEEIFEYRQADIISKNGKILDYDTQCEQLIIKLHTIRKMKAEFEKEQQNNVPIQIQFNKMQFNGNLNQLVDIFYQLNRELFVDGKSYIDGSTNDLISLIVNTFVDKEGNEISPLTVETILKPSRTDKRPKPHKRIDIDKIL